MVKSSTPIRTMVAIATAIKIFIDGIGITIIADTQSYINQTAAGTGSRDQTREPGLLNHLMSPNRLM